MSFRVSALVAALSVFGLSECSPAFAQPQAPVRPRYSSFGNIFSPNRPIGGFGFGQNQPFVNPIGPNVAGLGAGNLGVGGGMGPGGFFLPGQVALPQVFPGAYGVINPQLAPSGVVGTFNNLGHWYGGRYGHWYPNGVANGRGVLTNTGGGYGGGALLLGGGGVGGVGGAGNRAGGGLLGTAMTAGAAMNQFRR